MRALTQEEYGILSGKRVIEYDSPDRAHLLAISERLRIRGCMVRSYYANGAIAYNKTPLGELALRVSRPEMAFTI